MTGNSAVASSEKHALLMFLASPPLLPLDVVRKDTTPLLLLISFTRMVIARPSVPVCHKLTQTVIEVGRQLAGYE